MRLGKYKHFKGKEYEVVGVARDCETLDEVVVYKALYQSDDFPEGQLWIRPLSNFQEEVVVDGKRVKRFEFIG